jgi:three-Cys-motif partner protein
VGRYLPAYTTALQNTAFTLHYIDAFAGTGVCHIKLGGQRLMVPGSASIAMTCEPPFHRMVFIEKARSKARALDRLKERAPDRNITVIRGDANAAIPAYLQSLTRRDRAIVFLDPFGMEVAWSTLEKITASRVVDLWYLFPLFGLYRQATLDAADIDDDKAAALTRMLGTEEWRTAFYEPDRQYGLFGQGSDVRTADVPKMLDWVRARLEKIFPGVLPPKILHQMAPSGARGAPLFALFFAVSNPDAKARGLALRIAKGVLKD